MILYKFKYSIRKWFRNSLYIGFYFIITLTFADCSYIGMPGDSTSSVADRYLTAGQEAFNAGNYEAALANWRTALEYRPSDEQLHYQIGRALEHSGDPVRAIQEYRIALKLKPDFFQARYSLGSAIIRQGKVLSGIREYDRAFQTVPGFYDLKRGSSFASNAEWSLARKNARSFLLQALKTKDQHEKMIFSQKAIAADSTYSEAYNQLALFFFHTGQEDSAAIYYWRAIYFDPFNAEAWNNLGYIFSRNEDHSTAIRFYKNAIKNKSDYYVAFNNMAVSFYRIGRKTTAREIWQKILHLDPENRVARRWLESTGSG